MAVHVFSNGGPHDSFLQATDMPRAYVVYQIVSVQLSAQLAILEIDSECENDCIYCNSLS